MPNTVAQHAVATFTSPVNGSSPIDANTVRGNDNTTRTSYNNHDADPGIHVQSSTLASRPVAGTAGRKWITADAGSYKLWYDDGTTWHEVANTGVDVFVVAGEILAKGDVIKVTGYNNGLSAPIVAKVSSASDTAFGIVTGAISSGGTGYITNTGLIADVNTNAFAIGTTLYPNTSGGFTSTKPVAGTYQPVAYVLRSNTNNGVLYVEFSAPRIVERSDNTVSTLVLRDASGNFAAGTITAALTGNASTATTLQTARNINGVSFNGSADITVTAAAGTLTGNTLASNVTASSLTSVGTLTSLTVAAKVSANSLGSSVSGFTDYLNGGAWDILGASTAGSASTLAIGGYRSSQWIGIDFYTSGVSRALIDASGNLAVDTNTLYVDAANDRVGIQTATPAYPLQVRRAGGAGSLGVSIDNAVSQRTVQYFAIGDTTADTTAHAWYTRAGTATDVLRMSVDYLGNLAVDTNTLFVDAVNNRVGVGTATPASTLDVVGGNISIASGNVFYLSGSGGNAYLQESSGTVFIGAGGAGRVQVTSSGNFGLGVTPSAWAIGKVLQIASAGGAFVYGASGQTILGTNAFFDTSWKYGITGEASNYEQALGVHKWFTAPSGTAGAAISFTQAMTLSANGNAVIGDSTVDQARLRLWGTTNAGAGLQLFRDGDVACSMWGQGSRLHLGADGSTGFTSILQIKAVSGAVRFVGLSAAPTTNVENGDVYYDTTTNKLRVRAAGAWVDLH